MSNGTKWTIRKELVYTNSHGLIRLWALYKPKRLMDRYPVAAQPNYYSTFSSAVDAMNRFGKSLGNREW